MVSQKLEWGGKYLKRYVFLFLDETKSQRKCLCEQCVEARGMYDAFTKVQKIANDYAKELHCSLKIELKKVHYFDEFVNAI